MSTTLQPDEVADYRRRGFHLARGMLTRCEIREILDRGMRLERASDVPNRVMNPHREDDLFLGSFRHPAIVRVIERLVDEAAVGVQTMFYIKPPGMTGHGWHQDQNYIPGDPKPILAAWCALDDIDEENGALTVFPGSGRLGLLEMKPIDDPDFANHERAVEPPADIEPMTVPMSPGDVLFFDGLLIHGSKPNTSTTRFRRAFVSHYLAKGSSALAAGKGRELIELR
ncbi:MAG: hypothetical protein CMJ18_16095 [Phycisphaeraceae bacterium]|nr:hypothetical protein [Phycisphaeraceae bacterium]